MTTWNDWTSPTIEEIAACFPDLEREILGHSFGSKGPATITKVVEAFDSDGLFHPSYIRAYAFRVDWVSPRPFNGGGDEGGRCAAYRDGGGLTVGAHSWPPCLMSCMCGEDS